MKRINGLVFFVVLFAILHGCSMDNKAISQARHFLNAKINFPKECVSIINGTVEEDNTSDWNKLDFKLIILYTSDVCTDCTIMHIEDTLPFFSLSSQYESFAVFPIFSTPSDSGVIEKIKEKNFQHNVYVDTYGEMEKQVPNIASCHIFLLDKTNRVRFIGNPLMNNKSLNTFIKILSK